MNKYSINSLKWRILRNNIPNHRLNDEEDRYICLHDTLAPNGYNIKTNRTSKYVKEYSDKVRVGNDNCKKEAIRNNLHKYRRRNDKLKDVPQHVTYFESKGLRG
jgi:hypothetical protein